MTNNKENTIRINKYLSECGVASRRGADELILQGRVELNGVLVEEPGVRVNPADDVVLVDGRLVRPLSPAGDARQVTVLL
ncbi:MAG: pseudouridine synthase, partial [Desulfovibrio sp.]|nr:pseudouridine synthase [Desulfovibrio sp.]